MSLGVPSNGAATTPIKRVIWDLTYACPLRCVHCYSEAGRRPAMTLDRGAMARVAAIIVTAKPERISFSGGEPLLAPWWREAARSMFEAGTPVTLFTSGWLMDDAIAADLGRHIASVAVSVDGATADVHDAIRGRPGSFDRAMSALDHLDRHKRRQLAAGERCYEFGVDCTVTRSGFADLGRLVEELTGRFPAIDFVRFGAAIPEGLAQEDSFVERELLTEVELEALGGATADLDARSLNAAEVSVTDVRYFLPTSPLAEEGAGIIHIEPDGQVRACTNYEAKVGNILDEPLDVLWQRALAWRSDPFVAGQLASIETLADWARVVRVLDRRYGSESDKLRIARRGRPTVAGVGARADDLPHEFVASSPTIAANIPMLTTRVDPVGEPA